MKIEKMSVDEIKRRLSDILDRYSITVTEMAAELGISREHLSRLLAGDTTPQELTVRALRTWLAVHWKEYPIKDTSNA